MSTAIPPSIDAVLMALSGSSGYSPSLRKGLDRIALYVMRAFGVSPPDAGTIAKALTKGRECLALATAPSATSADSGTVQHLTLLLAELQAQVEAQPASPIFPAAAQRPASRPDRDVGVEEAAPPPPPSEASDAPRYIRAPPPTLARTLPLSIQLSDPAPPSQPPLPLPPPPVPPSPPLIVPPPQVASAPSPPIPLSVQPKARSPGAGAAGIKKVTAAILSRLAALDSRRRSLLADPLAQWGDLRNVDEQLDRAARVMKWIGREDPAGARDALANAEDEADVFAALMALLHGGGADAIAAALRERTNSAPSADPTLPSLPCLLAVFQLSADPALVPLVQALATESPTDSIRASALTALGSSGFVTPDRLIDLLDDPGEQVAARAAELLAWLGRSSGDAEVIQMRLRTEVPNGLRCSLLFAAIALGSAQALHDLRRMFDQGDVVVGSAIDALAVAGGADDAARLLQLATRQPDLAPLAILAAGHLGNPAAVGAIQTTTIAEVSSAVNKRAQQTILGSAPAAKHRNVRLLYGAPWTLATALQRLTASDELVRARSWYALEAAVRAGTRPGAVIDPHSNCAAQDRVVAGIRSLPALRRSVPAGSWLYEGRSMT